MVLNFGGQRKWLQNKMVGSAFRMMEFLLSTKLSKLILFKKRVTMLQISMFPKEIK